MSSVRERNRSRERLERLAASSLDLGSIQSETIAELRRVIGFDRWCWPVADPDTLIPLGAATELDFGQAVGLSLALEFSGRDVATMEELGRPASAASSLSSETRGDLPRSPRWNEVLRPVGIGDEAIAGVATSWDVGAGSSCIATATTARSTTRTCACSRRSVLRSGKHFAARRTRPSPVPVNLGRPP